MFFTDIQPVRARKTDPSTSHAAAKNAERFAATHAGRIMEALKEGPRSAKGLSAMTGLSVEQCCRRLPELQKANLAEPMSHEDGGDVVVGGFRVWRAVKGGE